MVKASDLRDHLPEILAGVERGRVMPAHKSLLLEIIHSWERAYNARASNIAKFKTGSKRPNQTCRP
jgi:hypothetical protein